MNRTTQKQNRVIALSLSMTLAVLMITSLICNRGSREFSFVRKDVGTSSPFLGPNRSVSKTGGCLKGSTTTTESLSRVSRPRSLFNGVTKADFDFEELLPPSFRFSSLNSFPKL